MDTDIIVLAAGKGTRMYSSLPKVLHPLAGRPLLSHVLDTAASFSPRSLRVVVGYGAEQVRGALTDFAQDLLWLEQREQLGTGHAVLQGAADLPDNGATLILYGDVPLISADTLRSLLEVMTTASVAVLTQHVDEPYGLGRIIRDGDGNVTGIVEEKDATEAQRRIREINTGIICAQNRNLLDWLGRLDNDNAQGEYYLTDIIGMAARDGEVIETGTVQDPLEAQGINNRLQLAAIERSLQRRQAEALALGGVTVLDPARLDIRGHVECGRDVTLDVNIIIEGTVHIGDRCEIGPNVVLKNCRIGEGCVVLANSHVEGADMESDISVGPFARIRPGTELKKGSKIGNFVETKKSIIGAGSKVNHLSYIGDTEMGRDVNVGAGTITCNYDGANKHRTTVGNGVFIGSNTAIVAPVTLHDGVTIAAGSTITADVPQDQLGVARGRQRNIDGWKRPTGK
ncbi:MAG: bifunctional UDP-N-acetylglucosamine diphosphorylase/glucosamine-1-phosphate N-acetyltransferase GlmU [Pseudohongiellaceae bacterium]